MSQTEKAPEYETWADDAGVCEKLCCPRSNACARDAINTQNRGGVTSPKSNTVPTPPNPPLQVGQNARNSKLKIQEGTIFDSFQFMLVDPDIVEESMTMQVFLTDPSSGDMGRAWGESNVCHSQAEIEHSFKKEFKHNDDAWFCWDVGEGSHILYFLIAAELLRLGEKDEVDLARLIKGTPAAKERYDVDHVSIITQVFRCAGYARVYILAKSKGKLFASFNSKAEKGKQWVVRRTFDGSIRVKSRPFEQEKERQYCPLASPRSVSRIKPPVFPLGTKEETLTTRMTVIKSEGGGPGAGRVKIHIGPGKGSVRNQNQKRPPNQHKGGGSGNPGSPPRRRSDEDPGEGAGEKTTIDVGQNNDQDTTGPMAEGEHLLDYRQPIEAGSMDAGDGTYTPVRTRSPTDASSGMVIGGEPGAHGDESQRQRMSSSVAAPPRDPAEHRQSLVSARKSGTSTTSASKEDEQSETGAVIPGEDDQGTGTSIANKHESEVKTPTDVRQHNVSDTTDHDDSESPGVARDKGPGELGDEQSVEDPAETTGDDDSEESSDETRNEKNIRIRMKNAASTSFQIAIDEESGARGGGSHGQTAPKLVTVSPGETIEYRQSLETARRSRTPTVNPSNDAESLLTLRVAVDDSSGRRHEVTE